MGYLGGTAGMALVVAGDLRQGRRGLVPGPHGEETFAAREVIAEAGLLHAPRPAGRQVGRAAVAEPAAVRGHVAVLADGELAPGSADVAGERGEGDRDLVGVSDSPAHLLQLRLRDALAGHRHLQRHRRLHRQLPKLAELNVLMAVRSSFVLQRLLGLPVHYPSVLGVRTAGPAAVRLPEL